MMCDRMQESRRRCLLFSTWLLVPMTLYRHTRVRKLIIRCRTFLSLFRSTADPVDVDMVVAGVGQVFGLIAAAAFFRSDWKATALPPAPEANGSHRNIFDSSHSVWCIHLIRETMSPLAPDVFVLVNSWWYLDWPSSGCTLPCPF